MVFSCGMGEKAALTPTSPPPPPPSSNPNGQQKMEAASEWNRGWWRKRPSLRLTTEFDSESSTLFHKASLKLLREGLAKLKLSFHTSPSTCAAAAAATNITSMVSNPQLSFLFSKLLSFHYDFADRSALLNASLPLGPCLRFSASHDLKAQEGEVSVLATLPDPAYALELSSPVPSFALPRASLKFPLGELTLEEKDDPDLNLHLSLSGILKGHILHGFYTAQYSDDNLMLRYCYKDEAVSFIPSISLPSNALSFAFKRRFNPSNKLSYWYNFDANTWSAAYKHTYGKDFKFKAGYDSEVRLGWASVWVGDEDGKAKTAPMKMKVQFMLQIPQDDIRSAALMFRVKKRWDI